MKTFPQPLSAAEESDCIYALKNGNVKEAAEAKKTLIEHNMRLVAHIVKKYQNIEEDPEDLISIGTIGLIKAVDSFDINKGRLATYACRCIDNELLMMLRSRKKVAREVSLYEPIGTDKEGNEISLLDVIENHDFDVVERLDTREKLDKLKIYLNRVLSRREREIINLRYGITTGREVTQNEIGKKLGISRSYVSRIEKKALYKLRCEFDKQENK